MKGSFREGSLLVSWDVVSMFPNIDNDIGLFQQLEGHLTPDLLTFLPLIV